jgi:heme-degrading monooxygenase HmoA
MDEGVMYSVGIWSVKTGKEEVFLKTWEDFAKWTMSNQKGARGVIMLQDAEQKNRLIAFGSWDDLESMQAWRGTPEFKAAFVRFKELCDEIKPSTMKSVINISSEALNE